MQINLAKSAVENVLALVNAANSSVLSPAEVTLGAPVVWVDPLGVNTRNTQVTLTAVVGSGYTGTVDVRLTRLTLEAVRGATVLDYTLLGSDTLVAIKAYVVAALGVVADQVELSVTEVPVVPNGQTSVTIQIQALATSLLYTGACDVTVFPEGDDELNTIVTDPELPGFEV